MNKVIDLTGKKFDKLLVLERDYLYPKVKNLKNSHAYWKCICDCGKIKTIDGVALRQGKTTSCGCFRKEKNGEINKKHLINQRFGRLQVIKETKERYQRNIIWECLCDCGNKVYVTYHSLLSGNTQSCGCLKSKGEEKIIQLLQQNKISYETQKTFIDCCSPNGFNLRFDFYINNSFLLEFDGVQHYRSGTGWNTSSNYEKIKFYDEIKNKYCIENNICLKRIPYWEIDNLTIEDILNDKFLIKNI